LSGYRIRRLTPADFAALLDYDWDPLVRERDTIYLFLAQDHSSTSFVAEDDEGGAVGYVIAARSADGRAVFVFHLHVRRDRRREGIGRALMERLETAAGEAGVECIWLLANAKASRFYTHIGYVQSRKLLDPYAARHVIRVKNASVLTKEIARPGTPIRA
jgi:predicted N-acetyltransferase YhbS